MQRHTQPGHSSDAEALHNKNHPGNPQLALLAEASSPALPQRRRHTRPINTAVANWLAAATAFRLGKKQHLLRKHWPLKRRTLALLTSCITLACPMPAFAAHNTHDASNPKVAIIGAGLAGLTAGYRLQQKGYAPEIYEARPRVGGRVHTVWIKNTSGNYSIAELGGQNITDGADAQNLLTLSQELGLEVVDYTLEHTHVLYDGTTLHDLHNVAKDYPQNLEKLREHFDQLRSQASCQSAQDLLDELFPKNSLLKRTLAIHLSGYEGSPANQLCAHHNIDTLQSRLENYIQIEQNGSSPPEPFLCKGIQGGNARLPLKLAEALRDRLYLNKALVSVQRLADQQIQLTFADGSQTLCDKLILAIPCPVYADIAFDPEVIPPERLHAFSQVQYGTAGKIMIAFDCPHRPWDCMLSDNMASFSSADKKLLNLYFFGELGAHLVAKKSECFQQGLQALKATHSHGTFDETQPIVATDKQFTYYDPPVARGWVEDPFAKGAYSNFGTALKEKFSEHILYKEVVIKKLFEPIENTIFFIGEHTTILKEIGTLEAAVESGERISKLF